MTEDFCTLRDRAIGAFRSRFGGEPSNIVAAPGRVNLIGEHTDYNDGFVLPLAIDRHVVIAARTKSGDHSEIFSAFASESFKFPDTTTHDWKRYVTGVLTLSKDAGLNVPAFEAVIESSVPAGAGLSSSAALEVAVATLAESLADQTLDPMQKARLCQQAEHDYAGVPCGIMDQTIAVLGHSGHLLLLDCRSLEPRHVPLPKDVAVLIINSGIKHDLATSEYAQRRADCETAARALDIPSLRDATPDDLPRLHSLVSETVYRRARHILTENFRVVDAVNALESGNLDRLGALLYESHESLRADYEVSCPELDRIVDIARTTQGVYGCRMTGAGFGGCAIALVRADSAHQAADNIRSRYHTETGIDPDVFTTCAVDGASVLPTTRIQS